MKQLIISIYDSAFGFSYVIVDNNKPTLSGCRLGELKPFNLINDFYNVDIELINSNNEAIQQFDQIIVCEDGGIDVFIKNLDY